MGCGLTTTVKTYVLVLQIVYALAVEAVRNNFNSKKSVGTLSCALSDF